MTAFLLKKWYLDCIDDAGLAWIGYHAELRWSGLRVFYASSLVSGARQVECSSMRAMKPPELSDGCIRWTEGRIGVEIETRPALPVVTRELVRTSDGVVAWNCVAPLSAVTVFAAGRTISGLGYAEVLEMTAPPWALEMSELRWGRFTADGSSVVWIDCSGEIPIRLGFRNGIDAGLTSVSETGVELNDGTRLSFLGTTVMKDETLSVPLRHLGVLARLIPRRVRDAREQKWLSRAMLTDGAGATAEGWVIHERVAFAQS